MEEEQSVVKVQKVKEAFNETKSEDGSDNDIEEDDDFEFDMEDMNLGTVLQNFLVNEDGMNVCDVLSGLKKSLDTQNKILMKIVNIFENKKK